MEKIKQKSRTPRSTRSRKTGTTAISGVNSAILRKDERMKLCFVRLCKHFVNHLWSIRSVTTGCFFISMIILGGGILLLSIIFAYRSINNVTVNNSLLVKTIVENFVENWLGQGPRVLDDIEEYLHLRERDMDISCTNNSKNVDYFHRYLHHALKNWDNMYSIGWGSARGTLMVESAVPQSDGSVRYSTGWSNEQNMHYPDETGQISGYSEETGYPDPVYSRVIDAETMEFGPFTHPSDHPFDFRLVESGWYSKSTMDMNPNTTHEWTTNLNAAMVVMTSVSKKMFLRETGEFYGVLLAALSLSSFDVFITDLLENSLKRGDIFIVDHQGYLCSNSLGAPNHIEEFDNVHIQQTFVRVKAVESDNEFIRSLSREIVARYGQWDKVQATSGSFLSHGSRMVSLVTPQLEGLPMTFVYTATKYEVYREVVNVGVDLDDVSVRKSMLYEVKALQDAFLFTVQKLKIETHQDEEEEEEAEGGEGQSGFVNLERLSDGKRSSDSSSSSSSSNASNTSCNSDVDSDDRLLSQFGDGRSAMAVSLRQTNRFLLIIKVEGLSEMLAQPGHIFRDRVIHFSSAFYDMLVNMTSEYKGILNEYSLDNFVVTFRRNNELVDFLHPFTGRFAEIMQRFPLKAKIGILAGKVWVGNIGSKKLKKGVVWGESYNFLMDIISKYEASGVVDVLVDNWTCSILPSFYTTKPLQVLRGFHEKRRFIIISRIESFDNTLLTSKKIVYDHYSPLRELCADFLYNSRVSSPHDLIVLSIDRVIKQYFKVVGRRNKKKTKKEGGGSNSKSCRDLEVSKFGYQLKTAYSEVLKRVEEEGSGGGESDTSAGRQLGGGGEQLKIGEDGENPVDIGEVAVDVSSK